MFYLDNHRTLFMPREQNIKPFVCSLLLNLMICWTFRKGQKQGSVFPVYLVNHVSFLILLHLPSPSHPSSRCNVQDYIWHKGARCESVVTEFQVMCLAVGASALVILLLFMIVVCFAKKLHVLKTENKKLRKRRWGSPSSLAPQGVRDPSGTLPRLTYLATLLSSQKTQRISFPPVRKLLFHQSEAPSACRTCPEGSTPQTDHHVFCKL